MSLLPTSHHISSLIYHQSNGSEPYVHLLMVNVNFIFFISFHFVRMCFTRLIKCITLIGVLGLLRYCRTVQSMNKTETQHNATDKIRFYYYSLVFVTRERQSERKGRERTERRRRKKIIVIIIIEEHCANEQTMSAL